MKTDAVPHPLAKFHGKRLLLDTNLLLPYFIGCFHRIHGQAPKPGPFTLTNVEFEFLAQIIKHFEKAGRIFDDTAPSHGSLEPVEEGAGAEPNCLPQFYPAPDQGLG